MNKYYLMRNGWCIMGFTTLDEARGMLELAGSVTSGEFFIIDDRGVRYE